ncbi:uncharacterized protein [Clytia hemisphaerica]|uniref:SWIM-type domain-containing protein n=1 Tax=Clytia hemisphaerica TaxID=252671 RepID=A0A7M6DNL9_9CNID
MEVNDSNASSETPITPEETSPSEITPPSKETPPSEETLVSEASKEEETQIQFLVETEANQQSSEEVTASLVTTTIDLSGIAPEESQTTQDGSSSEQNSQTNVPQSDEIEIAVAMVHGGVNESSTANGDVTTLQQNVVNDKATAAEDTFDDTDCTYVVARTHSELREAIRLHAEATGAQFCMSKRTKGFGNEKLTEVQLKGHDIRWNDPVKMRNAKIRHEFFNFNGVPFMSIANMAMNCQFGHGESEQVYLKRTAKRLAKDVKRRSHKTPSKKCGCPAGIWVRQVIKFPQFFMKKDTEYKRREMVRKIKLALKENLESVEAEFYYIGRLPGVSRHRNHEMLKGKERSRELLHKELRIMAQEMSFSNFRIKHIQEKINNHVINNWFYGQTPPSSDSTKYFPRGGVIRSTRERLFKMCFFSDEELLRLDEIIEKLKADNPTDNIWMEVKHVRQQDDEDDIYLDAEDLNLEDTEETPNKKLKNDKKMNHHQFHTFNFVYQNTWQQRMLHRYGRIVFITEVKHNKSAVRALTFKTYLLMVQTNVDFQVVGVIMHSKIKGGTSLSECLERFKSFSLQWVPKYFFVDVSEPIFSSIETAFPDAEYFLGPAQCRDKWISFLETPSNELKDHSEEILTYLDQMQKSYTKDILTACATVVEASEVWKESAVLREWFQTVWLPLAKRWVSTYRPEDIIVLEHGQDTFDDIVRTYSERISNSTLPQMQLGFFALLERIASPETTKKQTDRYFYLNKALHTECRHLESAMQIEEIIGIPLRLMPTFRKLKILYDESDFSQIEEQQTGVFKVVEKSEDLLLEELVSFGGNVTFPSCTCALWHQANLPCVHMYAVFRSQTMWKYDSLSALYRINPLLDFDYSCIDADSFSKNNGKTIHVHHLFPESKPTDEEEEEEDEPLAVLLKNQNKSVFKESSKIPESYLGKLKELKTQLFAVRHAFTDASYQKHLQADLLVLINQLEKLDQPDQDDAFGPLLAKKKTNNKNTSNTKTTAAEKTKATVDNKENSLRQTPIEYVSMASFKKPGDAANISTPAKVSSSTSAKKTTPSPSTQQTTKPISISAVVSRQTSNAKTKASKRPNTKPTKQTLTSAPVVPAKSIKLAISDDKKDDNTETKKIVKVLKKAVKDVPPEHIEIEYPDNKDSES